jgi:hypothetical protein
MRGISAMFDSDYSTSPASRVALTADGTIATGQEWVDV